MPELEELVSSNSFLRKYRRSTGFEGSLEPRLERRRATGVMPVQIQMRSTGLAKFELGFVVGFHQGSGR